MDLSVCVVTYERPSHVSRLLDSLADQDTPADEVVLVDDSDDDRTERVAESARDPLAAGGCDLVHVRREDGSGMTDARNAAIETAAGDVLAFLDDDVECPPDWIGTLRRLWADHPEAGAIGGPALIVDDDGEYAEELIRSDENYNWINEYGEQRSKEYRWLPSRIVETDQLGGANMSFRRETLTELGGFNAIYRGSEMYEDTDIMARLRRRDRTVLYCPELAVRHYETPKTGAQTTTEELYWVGWNGVVFRYVCFPETFAVSLLRLLVRNRGMLSSAWKKVGASLLDGTNRLWTLKGYVDGLRYVMENRESLPSAADDPAPADRAR